VNADAVPAAPPRRRALTTIFVTVLLDLIGFGMILPLLPFYAQELHSSAFQIGLLFSSYSLAQLVFAPILGRLSDRTGRRPVLLASIGGSVAAYIVFTAASSFAVLLLARTLAGVAAANYAIAQAYVADVSSRENRSKAMGLVGAAFGVGFVLGPALGGLLAHLGESTGLGARIVPLTAAILSGLNLVIAFFWLPESLSAELKGRSRQGSWLDVREFRAVWRNAPLRGLMLLFFLVIFCFSIMEASLALFCQARFGFGAAQTALLFVFVGVVLVVVQGGLLGRLVQRFGERGLILTGIVLMAAGLVLLPFTPASQPLAGAALLSLLGSLALLAVGQGMNQPSTLGLLSRLTDDSAQGSTIGLSRSFGALARTLGPATGTWIFGAVGTGWPFWTAGGLMLVALALAVNVLRKVSV
jgi:DHA1 family tetracycline resistance protein-like MFS transporter